MNDRPIRFATIEEVLNDLMRDEKIHSLRTALVEYVTDLLREKMQKRLVESGIDGKLEHEFLEGRTASVYQYLQERADSLGISQKQVREMKRIGKVDRVCAWEFLQQMLLEEEKLRFRKQAGIAAKVWLSFVNHTVLPGEATLDKLRVALAMTPEQSQEFERRVIRYVFQVDQVLRDTVHRLRKETGMSLTDFLNYAFIGKDAWEAFYPAEDDPNLIKKTSQDTLLKLVVGFGLNETGAWDFMDTAHSAFTVRKDLVVLSCIRCAYTDPIQVQEILEFFAEDGMGQRYYTNPYR